MASLTWWTQVSASSRSWWWTGKPGVRQSTGSQRVGHNWATELNSTDDDLKFMVQSHNYFCTNLILFVSGVFFNLVITVPKARIIFYKLVLEDQPLNLLSNLHETSLSEFCQHVRQRLRVNPFADLSQLIIRVQRSWAATDRWSFWKSASYRMRQYGKLYFLSSIILFVLYMIKFKCNLESTSEKEPGKSTSQLLMS